MHPSVERTAKDIKAIKIQGARNIAKAAVAALAVQAKASKATKADEFYSEILEVAELMESTRPTEPMMRNSIKEMTSFLAQKLGTCPLPTLKKLFIAKESEYQKKMQKNAEALMDYGAKLIEEGMTVLTICHSSTVTGMLRHAADLKDFNVVSCETRPLFQGRRTAEELAKAGVQVTQIVDSAAASFIRKANLVLVGADAVSARGDLYNKVGTAMVAHLAREHQVPFYSAAELYKYSPASLFGNPERIEQRDPKEVWDKPPKGVRIFNPAFDRTPPDLITGFITEEGIIPPQSFFSIASQKVGARL